MFSKKSFLYTLASPAVSHNVNKLMKEISRMKPDYYKIDIPKHLRKGKTQEEIMQMKIDIYNKRKEENNG